jgi:hypothetical protein
VVAVNPVNRFHKAEKDLFVKTKMESVVPIVGRKVESGPNKKYYRGPFNST